MSQGFFFCLSQKEWILNMNNDIYYININFELEEFPWMAIETLIEIKINKAIFL